MTPASAIANLDRKLRRWGQTIELQRLSLGPSGQQVAFSVTCRAIVRGYRPDQLVGGITQQDAKLIMSPTEINRADWPGAQIGTSTRDKRVPIKGDRAVIAGRIRTVEEAEGFYMNDVLVRIEARARG